MQTIVNSRRINDDSGFQVGPILTSVGYTHDRAGRRTHATREDGTTWRYEYNARGEVTNAAKLLPDQTALAGQQFAYLYDDIGNRTSARYGGGTGTNAGPEREISYTPNALNQYSSISHPQTANILGLSDENAGPVTVVGQIGTTDQQESRFRAEVGTTDPDGEWVDVEVAQGSGPPVSQGSRWIPGATVQRFHDDDGNLLNDGRWKYTWDAENRLTRLEPTPDALAGGHPDHVLEFAYDHLSRRIRKQVIDRANNDAVLSDRRFLYDGWNLIAEFEASPQNSLDPVAYHAWANDLSGTPQGAGGVGGLYASHVKRPSNGTWENYFPTYDGNGNIIAWINEQGQVAQRLDYDAFGNVLTKQGTLPGGVELNFGFSTKYQDQRTGLLYYGYRYFDPVTGRWPSRDPIGERGGVNLYGMVGNYLIDWIDILGLKGGSVKDLCPAGFEFLTGPAKSIWEGKTVSADKVKTEDGFWDRIILGDGGQKTRSRWTWSNFRWEKADLPGERSYLSAPCDSALTISISSSFSKKSRVNGKLGVPIPVPGNAKKIIKSIPLEISYEFELEESTTVTSATTIDAKPGYELAAVGVVLVADQFYKRKRWKINHGENSARWVAGKLNGGKGKKNNKVYLTNSWVICARECKSYGGLGCGEEPEENSALKAPYE